MISASGIVQFALLASFMFKAADGALEYKLEVDSNGPITTGALGTVKARLLTVNSTGSFIASPKLYHFHWIYSYLSLTDRLDDEFHSLITVRSEIPGTYTVAVSVSHASCWRRRCPNVAENATLLQFTESVVGNLLVAQTEGNATFIRDGLNLATETPTKMSFMLHDPSDYFSAALFTYRWEFGDGTLLLTDAPEVYHNYSSAGKYSLSLGVNARPKDGEQQKSGVYTATLQLLDAVKSIKVKGPTDALVEQKLSLSVYVNGSPPLLLCWLILSECVPLLNHPCHLVDINVTHYSLDYMFNDTGQYCLSMSVQNSVSMLQAFHDVTITENGVHPILFILPCAVLLLTVVVFIVFTALRGTRPHKDMVEVADFDFSPMADKPTSLPDTEVNTVNICCRSCLNPKDDLGEDHPLLQPRTSAVQSYTM